MARCLIAQAKGKKRIVSKTLGKAFYQIMERAVIRLMREVTVVVEAVAVVMTNLKISRSLSLGTIQKREGTQVMK